MLAAGHTWSKYQGQSWVQGWRRLPELGRGSHWWAMRIGAHSSALGKLGSLRLDGPPADMGQLFGKGERSS